MFCHSLLSDWNHGNAHFLRGIASELVERGHDFAGYEPRDGWSMQKLVHDHGDEPIHAFRRAYPMLDPIRYDPATLDIPAAVDGADLVLVHEWNDPGVVARIGRARADGGTFRLLFHDTHHRAATAPAEMERFELTHYDGVLAFGETVRQIYLDRGWTQRAWTWHEAADTRVFRPLHDPAAPAAQRERDGDIIWIGNWGDDERTAELREYFIDPVRALRARAVVHGVRYPEQALRLLGQGGIEYASWLPNFRVPERFARFRATVHVPRAPYARTLPGIPTIRPFEALACGIPLISAPWDDCEGLFRAGIDYLEAAHGSDMRRHMRDILNDADHAAGLAASGLETIRARHTCAHRVDELLRILEELGSPGAGTPTGGHGSDTAEPATAASP
jgi:spore maturation protein CgeB